MNRRTFIKLMACAIVAPILQAKDKSVLVKRIHRVVKIEDYEYFCGVDWGDAEHGVLYYWSDKGHFPVNAEFRPLSREPFPVLAFPNKS